MYKSAIEKGFAHKCMQYGITNSADIEFLMKAAISLGNMTPKRRAKAFTRGIFNKLKSRRGGKSLHDMLTPLSSENLAHMYGGIGGSQFGRKRYDTWGYTNNESPQFPTFQAPPMSVEEIRRQIGDINVGTPMNTGAFRRLK